MNKFAALLAAGLLILPFKAGAEDKILYRTLSGHGGEVLSIAFSPDGKLLASAGFDRVVNLWDAAGFKGIRRIEGRKAAVNSVSFSPDGGLLASGAADGTAVF